jgi:endonuclease-3
VVRRLAALYPEGHPARPRPARRDPLGELVFTVLSQATSDWNRDRAWAALRRRFPRWEDVLRAGPRALERAIAPGGLAPTKARRILAILRAVRAREGRLSLARLRRLPDEEVARELAALPGVGPKTVACVLAFSLGRPRLPVDTHVHRVARRLGLAPPGAPPAATQALLEALVPPPARLDVHLAMIAHGRTTCRAVRPACGRCALAGLCPSAALE